MDELVSNPTNESFGNKNFKTPPYFLKKMKDIREEIFTEALKIRRQREGAHFLVYLPQSVLTFFLSIYLGLLVI